ncbi:MAG: hypothetical protein AB7S77_23205 [Desulfatirhabdiaceae bacterium]
MHHYDIAAIMVIETCRDEILRRFMNLDANPSTFITYLPRETVSVRRSEVVDQAGMQTLFSLTEGHPVPCAFNVGMAS